MYFEFQVYMFSHGRDMTNVTVFTQQQQQQHRCQGYSNTLGILQKQPR